MVYPAVEMDTRSNFSSCRLFLGERAGNTPPYCLVSQIEIELRGVWESLNTGPCHICHHQDLS